MNDPAWLKRHVALLQSSYRHWTGQDLIPPEISATGAPAWLENAPFGVVSHDTSADPVFNYANRQALTLFEYHRDTFTRLPSRLSAEAPLREEREALLQRVSAHGYIGDYSGIRIAASGRRFLIQQATVWNLLDEAGQPYGQAALIRSWQPLAPDPASTGSANPARN